MPVLPQEDPHALEERIQAWIDDWKPSGATEHELARRGARLAWMLERGERAEAAHLARKVRTAARRAGPTAAASARRMKGVEELGRKLFTDYRPPVVYGNPLPPWDDRPAYFVAALEATPEGCRWLLDRWGEARTLMRTCKHWAPPDVSRYIRLLGKHGYEAIHDPQLNGLFLAWDIVEPGSAELIWRVCRGEMALRERNHRDATDWRELGPRPADEAAALALLWSTAGERMARLEGLLGEHEATVREQSELADLAAFDAGAGLDRHRRQMAALGRELLRTVETLRRLRKDGGCRATARRRRSDRIHKERPRSRGSPRRYTRERRVAGAEARPARRHPGRARDGNGARTEQDQEKMRSRADQDYDQEQDHEQEQEQDEDEGENATTEANLGSTQELKIKEVMSNFVDLGSTNEPKSLRAGRSDGGSRSGKNRSEARMRRTRGGERL